MQRSMYTSCPLKGSTIIRTKVIGITGYNEVGESRKEMSEELEEGALLDLQWEEDPIEEKFVVRVLPDSTSADIGKLGKKDAAVVFPLLKANYSYVIAVEENTPEELIVNILPLEETELILTFHPFCGVVSVRPSTADISGYRARRCGFFYALSRVFFTLGVVYYPACIWAGSPSIIQYPQGKVYGPFLWRC